MRFLIGVILIVGCVMPPAEAVFLVGATVYDGRGGAPITDAVIRVEDGRIACVGTREECPVEAGEVVDFTGRFITPGLVDAHVHFSQTGWLDGRPDSPLGRVFYDYEALQRRLRGNPDRWHRAFLCSGITAVFDVGGFPWTIGYRDAAERAAADGDGATGDEGSGGEVTGDTSEGAEAEVDRAEADRAEDNPRAHVSAAGPLITHADNPYLRALGSDTFLPMSSDEEAIASVRQVAEWGADAVKVWYIDPPAGQEEMLAERLIEMGEEARSLGLPLIVHATELENAKTALRAGARMLVHSVEDQPVDDEFIRLAKENDAVYVPTLLVGRNWTRAVASVGLGETAEIDDPNECVGEETLELIGDASELQETAPPAIRDADRLEEWLADQEVQIDRMQANVLRVARAGITVATGTDAGNPLTVHGPSIYEEMEAMQAAGLSPEEIIVMSTRNGAQAMGRLNDLGTLEAGKAADLVVLEEDPREDVRAFRSIIHVMREGALLEMGELEAR